MINFTDTTSTLFTRGITFTIEEYLFCLNLVLGEDENVSYALAFDQENFKKVLGTEEEQEFCLSKKQECSALLQQQHIIQLRQEMQDLYTQEIQSKAMNLEDYRFTGGQIAQILQNLLHNRVSDLDSASTKDVISLIKMLTEQFGLDGGSDFEKHFIQIYPKFNAICTSCNREFQISDGLSAKCPHCGQLFAWDEEEKRFYPSIGKL